MARPKREITMARCAGAALLAAIEIYNKPTVEYREQTFALLVTNAWEVLLKARIVQLSGGRLNSIYRRKARFEADRSRTGNQRTAHDLTEAGLECHFSPTRSCEQY